MKIFERVITSVLSAILFSLAISLFYSEIKVGFLIYLLVSLPIFLVGGIAFSILVDHLLNRNQVNNRLIRYMLSFFLYSLGGILFNFLLYIMILEIGLEREIAILMLFGIVASLTFLHVRYVVHKVWKN